MTQSFPCPYLGQNVELTAEREQHIIQTHPGTLPDYFSQLAQTLNDPDEVFSSNSIPMLYFSQNGLIPSEQGATSLLLPLQIPIPYATGLLLHIPLAN